GADREHVGDRGEHAAVDEPERLLERVRHGHAGAHLGLARVLDLQVKQPRHRRGHDSQPLPLAGTMAPQSAQLQSLAPDQRAAVELVLRRGLSYGELADLLGLPEDTVRARARAGLEALAPDLPPPARAGEVADWLLGQQAPAHAARTQA